jgi:hypothetical protein
LKLKDYEATLMFDSTGKLIKWGEGGGQAGFQISGFSIEEAANGKYFLAGNQAVAYLDTNILAIWEKKYTIWLQGVGTVTNNITRCKKLRNGTIMVAGQAYEGNCWTNFQSLYYDAWWSPISIANGANTTWDTAGVQGQSDIIYDFTQLINGNLVFTGVNGNGVWAFVTDSTGKEILWQGNSILPGVDANGGDLRILRPLSVCATPDTGFTIVGDNNTFGNNHNAFAMHWVSKQPVSVHDPRTARVVTNTRCTIHGGQARFHFTLTSAADVELSVFDAQGKLVAHLSKKNMGPGAAKLNWDASLLGKGVYMYQMQIGENVVAGKIVK